MRKSTTHRDGNVLDKWSILKLVSMPHSCLRMTDHCDMITPPIEVMRYVLGGNVCKSLARVGHIWLLYFKEYGGNVFKSCAKVQII